MTAPSAPATLHVLLFDRSSRLRMQFTGPKAAESLTGLVTNDVLALRGGDGVYACALTAKGRIIADVRILATAAADGTIASFLVDANAAGGVGFAAMIRKYVNPRLAKYVDISVTTSCLTLSGAAAIALLQSVGADADASGSVAAGHAFTHRAITIGTTAATLVRVPDLGDSSTFDLHCERAQADQLMAALVAAGAVLTAETEWHRLRVTAGRPEWGVDMDESTLAQEANMDALHAISYQKGCYTGQETVARVHFRGHVNRTLRLVQFPDGIAPPHGSALLTADDAAVGDSRSTALADAGPAMGIAMLRREVADAVSLRWLSDDGGAHVAIVLGGPDDA